ncbi:hypothetical protein QNM97_10100 [Gordonia sp. L191]|uniref:hypothetical protein n=1 Tax=Gordonia sp. L191 TaxID=2982699 RepID=UPI0024C0E157|nr:hypothetical protein [Gordonia sp. L191]WHU49288.1 hypothetical protein QNM97_10100 [Gordonia sp. L191]
MTPSESGLDFDEVADELYGLPPGDFTGRRNALARQARGAGDRDLATAIAALRRPTQSAWLLNQWIRRHPDGADEITELAAALRDAQRRADAARMRDLSARRQQVIAEVAGRVTHLAADLGVTVSGAADREIVATLRAAVADESTATLLCRGRMVAAAEYTGFGPAGIVAVPAPTTAEEAQGDTGDGRAGHGEAERSAAREHTRAELRRARETATSAQQGATDAQATATAARDAAEVLAADADRLRAELARVEQELGFARRRATAAEHEYASVAKESAAASARVAALEQELGELDDHS